MVTRICAPRRLLEGVGEGGPHLIMSSVHLTVSLSVFQSYTNCEGCGGAHGWLRGRSLVCVCVCLSMEKVIFSPLF